MLAYYKENDSTSRIIGKINVASYPLITHHVIMVPMQAGNIDKSTIDEGINRLYAPYGVTWRLTVDEPFTDRSWDTGYDGLQGSGTEFYSMFTEEMRALNAQYTALRGTDDKSVYLFWFAESASDAITLQGDMPLESRFGYIFSESITAETHHTIAHELAHGVFQLRHPFSDKYGLTQNTTSNLLDYDGGVQLKKYQWDLIHDPQNMLFAWAQGEEEGAYISEDNEIEWVLEIYSPQISEKFKTAKENDDYYEMRRLAYWALQNKFDNNWNEDVTLGFELPDGNPVASLRRHTDAKYGGVRVYYTTKKYVDGKFVGIMARTEPFYFKPHTKAKYFDAYFPVDVKLYEGEGNMPTGDTYYKNNDFIGEYSEAALVIGGGKGSGFMVGYMRGFGYCEYAYSLKGGGLNITAFSYGVIEGKYTLVKGEQTPADLSGEGSEISYGAYNTSGTTWKSVRNDGTIVFEGTSKGFAVGISVPNGALGGLKTSTQLLFPLKK